MTSYHMTKLITRLKGTLLPVVTHKFGAHISVCKQDLGGHAKTA